MDGRFEFDPHGLDVHSRYLFHKFFTKFLEVFPEIVIVCLVYLYNRRREDFFFIGQRLDSMNTAS